jgi:hypothetical protein
MVCIQLFVIHFCTFINRKNDSADYNINLLVYTQYWIMENLFIEGSSTMPTVEFNTSGLLKIVGRALPENAHQFFSPLITWVKEFIHDDVTVEINLEYFNTAVSKQLYDFLKAVEGNTNFKKIKCKWFYEDGDDEILESGEIYEDLLPNIKFEYHKYAEVYEE